MKIHHEKLKFCVSFSNVLHNLYPQIHSDNND